MARPNCWRALDAISMILEVDCRELVYPRGWLKFPCWLNMSSILSPYIGQPLTLQVDQEPMHCVCLKTMGYLRLAFNSRRSTTLKVLTPLMNSTRFWLIFIPMLNRIVLLCLLSKIYDSFIFLDIETSKIRETQYRVEKAIQILLYHIKFHLGVGNRVCTNPFSSPYI